MIIYAFFFLLVFVIYIYIYIYTHTHIYDFLKTDKESWGSTGVWYIISCFLVFRSRDKNGFLHVGASILVYLAIEKIYLNIF